MRSSPERSIDLNADVGEGADDEPLFALITSANIACGGHAGSDETMRRAVSLAVGSGVAIGAHPSYPDREGFGRVTMSLPSAALSGSIAEQIAALVDVATALGTTVAHVKPHGALYNDAALRRDVALAVAEGAALASGSRTLVGLSGSPALDLWRERGFRVVAEGFADRAYAGDGTLVPRTKRDALITDPAAAAAQAVRLASDGICGTICVHADTPGAAAIAAAVRRALEAAGFSVSAASPVRPRRLGPRDSV